MLHAENTVVVNHGADAVSDGDDGAVGPLDEGAKSSLHQRVRGGVDRGLEREEREKREARRGWGRRDVSENNNGEQQRARESKGRARESKGEARGWNEPSPHQ